MSQTNVEEYHSKTTHPGWIYANYHFLTVGIVSVKSVITGHKHDNSYAYLLLLHCCRLGWLSITAWLQETVKSPKRSQRDSNSSENSSCFAVEIRVTLENHGKTLENRGKTLEIPGKTLEIPGKHCKFFISVFNLFFSSSLALIDRSHLGFEKASGATLSKALQTSVTRISTCYAIKQLANGWLY